MPHFPAVWASLRRCVGFSSGVEKGFAEPGIWRTFRGCKGETTDQIQFCYKQRGANWLDTVLFCMIKYIQ